MNSKASQSRDRWDPEPRWPAAIAVFTVGGLLLALPDYLIIGPRWLFPSIVGVLLVPTVITHKSEHHYLNKIFGFTVSVVVTIGMIISVGLLVKALPAHKQTAMQLLSSAGFVWLTNVFVFALWYWRLDAGGPHHRDATFGHVDGAFLFPQMQMHPEAKVKAGEEAWSPNFVDYLFLAFNTSTAFSPTDTLVLSRWAKVLTMLQALVSLTVLVLLAARAVNLM
ncbi:MAG TPA: hypothetical protein VLL54_14430 [Pyrinomonadaceae bacterium]|nr:hypothetical protein [Pyrinomonadaceae bacterium]